MDVHTSVICIDDDDVLSFDGEFTDGEFTDTMEEPTFNEEKTTEGGDLRGSLVGQRSLHWNELYDMYSQHAKEIGFSIRLGTTRRVAGPGSAEYERYFVCSCQGTSKSPQPPPLVIEDDNGTCGQTRMVNVTRTNCKAQVRTKLITIGNDRLPLVPPQWEVIHHIIEHNHPLTPPQWHHLHRSERRISEAEGEIIEIMTDARMPTAAQYRYMAACSGGEDLVGHSKRDHYNFVNKLKMRAIEGGDAASLINLLSQRQADDAGFFYRVLFDEDHRLSHVFWRDSMMKEDYLLYHDVMVFDTTYCTNKYNLICGAFVVGINNHWSNVMFGCAFIANEKTKSFEWLFDAFKDSMGGTVLPTSIFTDQDQAMDNAIEKAFPSSKHRLCQWHIQQNAMSHFGSLKHDRTFQNVFNKCLRGCYSEDEFEATWRKMISDYGLEDDEWFDRLYGLRNKWSTAFSKDFFSAGILSSQRSESTSHAMGFQASKTTTVTKFYGIYEDTVKRWRSDEEQNEFQCLRATPKSIYPMVGLLRHASQIYTLKLFRDFEQEFGEAIGTKAIEKSMDGSIKVYDVHPESRAEAVHEVMFDQDMLLIDCSCRNFQESGWLCFHAIRILHLHSITEIPERYITRRWTRFAKTEVWNRVLPQDKRRANQQDIVSWRRNTLTTFHNVMLKCQNVPQARELLDKIIRRDVTEVEDFFKDHGCGDENPANVITFTNVLDPVRSKTKGRSERKKRQPSKRKKKNVEQQTPVPYTPLPRLF